MLGWINANEPLWLFFILSSELIVGLATFAILIVEYFYDKSKDDNKLKRKKTTKSRVKVVIDSNGNAQILEQPKDVDVSIEHEAKQ
jgi:hypothetical protein